MPLNLCTRISRALDAFFAPIVPVPPQAQPARWVIENEADALEVLRLHKIYTAAEATDDPSEHEAKYNLCKKLDGLVPDAAAPCSYRLDLATTWQPAIIIFPPSEKARERMAQEAEFRKKIEKANAESAQKSSGPVDTEAESGPSVPNEDSQPDGHIG